MLTDAPWPGNVRELASVIERAVVFGVGETIDAHHLASVWTVFPAQAGKADAQARIWPFPIEAPWTLRRLSRAYAEWVLAETGGNKERAAKILGIDLSTMYRWLRRDEPGELAAAGHRKASPAPLDRGAEPHDDVDVAC
jgi:two-component system response regulator HydG